jgi:hypothetical protein
LPRTFTRGLLFHLLYALALVFVSYFLFKKSLFRLNEDKNKPLAAVYFFNSSYVRYHFMAELVRVLSENKEIINEEIEKNIASKKK